MIPPRKTARQSDGQAPPSFALHTLGCKVNQCDSEAIAAELVRRGFAPAADKGRADVFLVNTCTVTHVADAKARKLMRKLIRRHPGRPVIVVGCGARLARSVFEAVPGVAAVVPGHEPAEVAAAAARAGAFAGKLPDHGESMAPVASARAGRSRAFLKVQDGCDHNCTYCIVPRARPRVCSRPTEECVREVEALAAKGAKEVVLVGIRLGAFGRGIGESLAGLLRQLRGTAIPRLRLSSLEPMDLTEDLLVELADHPLLCRHLHLPLQSGDDAVLRAMGRGYSATDYLGLVDRVRASWPDASFTTDVMVGFPGESEAGFRNTYELVSRVGFSRLHVFQFSARPGTVAATLPSHVPERTKGERSRTLARLAEELAARRAAEQVGTEVEILFEDRDGDGGWSGYTRGYTRARCGGTENLGGELRETRVVRANGSVLEVALI